MKANNIAIKYSLASAVISSFEVINDSRLTLTAKGLYAYILNNDSMLANPIDLLDKATDNIESINLGLQELVTYGYISSEKIVNMLNNKSEG